MQEKMAAGASAAPDSFIALAEKARAGDNEAMERLLELFDGDIRRLARFIRMSREDSMQEIRTALIELIRKGTDGTL